MIEKTIDVKQAAQIMNVHPLTIKRRINKYKKYWFKFGGEKNSLWKIERSNFDKWIKEISESK